MATNGRSYLGMSIPQALALAAASAAAGVALSLALPAPTCDDGERCATATEYAETIARLEAIRETHTGGRFDAYEACAAMLAADDWDATGCVGDFPDLDARSRVVWGPDGDPETGADR